MGTIVRRGAKWRAVVRRKGHKTRTRTFSRKALAQQWVRETEYLIERQQVEPSAADVGDLLTRYHDETAGPDGWGRTRRAHVKMLARQFAGVSLAELDGSTLARWARGHDISPGSRMRYLSVLAGALQAAENLWGVVVPWEQYRKARRALDQLGLIGQAGERTVRVSDEAIAAIKAEARACLIPLSDIIDFALLTGLRVGEVCRVEWRDLDEARRLLLVRDRKAPRRQKGNNTLLPLLGDALEIVLRQPRGELIFPYNPESVSAAFSRCARRAGFPGLSFHALRHECASRLFEAGLSIPEVALVTGHRHWGSLRRYTNLRPEDLHSRVAGKRKPGE